jgi:hypothetical protein
MSHERNMKNENSMGYLLPIILQPGLITEHTKILQYASISLFHLGATLFLPSLLCPAVFLVFHNSIS